MRFFHTISMHLGLQGVALILLPLAAVLCAADSSADQQANHGATGEAEQGRLRIEGRGIDRLTLHNEAGQATEITRPGESVSLPVGKYRIWEVELTGGFHCYAFATNPGDSFQVAADQVPMLQVGAPLTPQIRVQRAGRLLTLDYDLVDARGRRYLQRGAGRNDPPKFTVYKEGQAIGSGSFEYG